MCNWKLYFVFLKHVFFSSKEPSQWDGSFEHSKHLFKLMGKKMIKSLLISAFWKGILVLLILTFWKGILVSSYLDFLKRYTCFFLSRLFEKVYLFLVSSGLGVPSHIRSSPASSTQHRVWSGSSSSENCSWYYRVAPALHHQHDCHFVSAYPCMLYSSSSSLWGRWPIVCYNLFPPNHGCRSELILP